MANSFATPQIVLCQAPMSMGFPSKNTGVGCHILLKEIFPTQELNCEGSVKAVYCHPAYLIYKQSACMCAQSLQSCSTLCDPMECSPPVSSAHGILQARILEWVTMPSSRGSFWPRDWTCISMCPVLAGGFFTTSATWEAPIYRVHHVKCQARRLTS